MFKKISLICFYCALFFLLSSCENVPPTVIDLNDLDHLELGIDIPLDARKLILSRGSYKYTFKRVKALSDEVYYIDQTDISGFIAKQQQAPEDVYAVTFKAIPVRDKRAMKALGNYRKDAAQYNDMSGLRKMMTEDNYLDSIRMNAAIIAADYDVCDISQDIRKEDRIKLTGICFKITKVTNNNKEEPISFYQKIYLFYTTELEIVE